MFDPTRISYPLGAAESRSFQSALKNRVLVIAGPPHTRKKSIVRAGLTAAGIPEQNVFWLPERALYAGRLRSFLLEWERGRGEGRRDATFDLGRERLVVVIPASDLEKSDYDVLRDLAAEAPFRVAIILAECETDSLAAFRQTLPASSYLRSTWDPDRFLGTRGSALQRRIVHDTLAAIGDDSAQRKLVRLALEVGEGGQPCDEHLLEACADMRGLEGSVSEAIRYLHRHFLAEPRTGDEAQGTPVWSGDSAVAWTLTPPLLAQAPSQPAADICSARARWHLSRGRMPQALEQACAADDEGLAWQAFLQRPWAGIVDPAWMTQTLGRLTSSPLIEGERRLLHFARALFTVVDGRGGEEEFRFLRQHLGIIIAQNARATASPNRLAALTLAIAAATQLGEWRTVAALKWRIEEWVSNLSLASAAAMLNIIAWTRAELCVAAFVRGDFAAGDTQASLLTELLSAIPGSRQLHVFSLGIRALMRIIDGDRHAAERILGDARRAMGEEDTHSLALRLARALCAIEVGPESEATDGIQAVEDGLRRSYLWPYLLHARVMLMKKYPRYGSVQTFLCIEDLSEGDEYEVSKGGNLKIPANVPQESQTGQRYWRIMGSAVAPAGKAVICSSMTQVMIISRLLQQAVQGVRIRSLEKSPAVAVVSSWARYFTNDIHGGIQQVGRVQHLDGVTKAQMIDSMIVSACLFWQLGRRDESLTMWRASLVHARRYGLTTPFALVPQEVFSSLMSELRKDSPHDVADLLRYASDQGIHGLPRYWRLGIQLTDAEIAVLSLLAQNKQVKDIAVFRSVSMNTVKSQIRSIYRKMGVSNRPAAIELGIERGYIRPIDTQGPTGS